MFPIGNIAIFMNKTGNIEHDREATENKLIVAIGQMIEENGFEKMSLHARDTAVPFYNKLNYLQVGEPFIEVGITHFELYKVL